MDYWALEFAWLGLKQIVCQVWSFGRDQIVGLILAVLYQLHSGMMQSTELKKTGFETILYPYLTLICLLFYMNFYALHSYFITNKSER